MLNYRLVSDVMITCLTPPVSVVSEMAAVTLQFDGDTFRSLASQQFRYYDNPTVSDVTPSNSYQRYCINDSVIGIAFF